MTTAKTKLGMIQFRRDFAETENRLNRNYKEIYRYGMTKRENSSLWIMPYTALNGIKVMQVNTYII